MPQTSFGPNQPKVTPPASPEIPAQVPTVNFFFVHPAPWMREEMIPAFIRAEIPAHGIAQFNILPRVCRKYANSVFILNADQGPEGERANWPQTLAAIAGILIETHATIIFIARGLTQTRKDELRLLGIAINFIELNQASKTLTEQIYTVANALSQKGQRRSIRVNCAQTVSAFYNLLVENQQYRGELSDISSAGMAAVLPDPYPFNIIEGYELNGLQLKLKGSLVLVQAIVAAVRKNHGQSVMVCLFRWGDDKRSLERIHSFIGSRLQENLDQLII